MWTDETVLDMKVLEACPTAHVLLAKVINLEYYQPELAKKYPNLVALTDMPILVWGPTHAKEKRSTNPDRWHFNFRPITHKDGNYRLGSVLHAPIMCMLNMFEGEVGAWVRRLKQVRLLTQQKVLILARAMFAAYPTLVG